MIRDFRYKGKNIEVIECKSFFSKFRGLMFRKKSKPLLFVFDKPTTISIHSFFCKSFIAAWFLDGKIIEKRVVNPFSWNIKPKKPYTELLEIIID